MNSSRRSPSTSLCTESHVDSANHGWKWHRGSSKCSHSRHQRQSSTSRHTDWRPKRCSRRSTRDWSSSSSSTASHSGSSCSDMLHRWRRQVSKNCVEVDDSSQETLSSSSQVPLSAALPPTLPVPDMSVSQARLDGALLWLQVTR